MGPSLTALRQRRMIFRFTGLCDGSREIAKRGHRAHLRPARPGDVLRRPRGATVAQAGSPAAIGAPPPRPTTVALPVLTRGFCFCLKATSAELAVEPTQTMNYSSSGWVRRKWPALPLPPETSFRFCLEAASLVSDFLEGRVLHDNALCASRALRRCRSPWAELATPSHCC